jgi:hypothetical protein
MTQVKCAAMRLPSQFHAAGTCVAGDAAQSWRKWQGGRGKEEEQAYAPNRPGADETAAQACEDLARSARMRLPAHSEWLVNRKSASGYCNPLGLLGA